MLFHYDLAPILLSGEHDNYIHQLVVVVDTDDRGFFNYYYSSYYYYLKKLGTTKPQFELCLRPTFQ